MEKSIESNATKLYPQSMPSKAPQALILAAGRGKRLGSKVEEIPKCLLKVGGRSLLDHQLTMFAAAGITDVCVVAGYHRRVVANACRGRAHVMENVDWATTNSLYSLSLASTWVNRGLVVINCDVLVEPIVVSKLIRDGSSRFAVDRASGGEDEHMKVQLADGCLVAMSKSLDDASIHGENVGILHFSRSDARQLFQCAKEALLTGGDTQWMAAAVQMLATRRCLEPMDISELAWIEIDYAHDLERAREKVWPLIERRQTPRTDAYLSAMPNER